MACPILGRPTRYSEEIVEEILARIADGESLRSICSDERLPDEKTIRGWVIAPNQSVAPDFLPRYARARNIGLDVQAEGMTALADDQSIDPNSRRIMIDTRKWIFSKMRPDKYGDKLTLDGNITIASIAETLREREKRLAADAEIIEVAPAPAQLPAPCTETPADE